MRGCRPNAGGGESTRPGPSHVRGRCRRVGRRGGGGGGPPCRCALTLEREKVVGVAAGASLVVSGDEELVEGAEELTP